MIAKLISISVIIGLTYGGTKMLDGQKDFIANFGKIIGTSSEVHIIAKKLYYDFVINGISLNTLSQTEFGRHLREQMRSSDPARDTSRDMWRTPYRLTMIGSDQFEVRSAGPDCRFKTDDDIVASGKSR